MEMDQEFNEETTEVISETTDGINGIIELEKKVKKMVQNIEMLDKEATSFAVAKKELKEAANEFTDLTINIKKVAKDSGDMLKEVQSIGVQSTINKLNESVERMTELNNSHINNFKLLNEEERQKTNKALKNMLSTNIITLIGFSLLSAALIILSALNII